MKMTMQVPNEVTRGPSSDAKVVPYNSENSRAQNVSNAWLWSGLVSQGLFRVSIRVSVVIRHKFHLRITQNSDGERNRVTLGTSSHSHSKYQFINSWKKMLGCGLWSWICHHLCTDLWSIVQH